MKLVQLTVSVLDDENNEKLLNYSDQNLNQSEIFYLLRDE